MPERLLLPGSVIDAMTLELPPDVLRTKLAAEEKAALEMLSDHLESLRVNAEHASIWQEREPLATPANFTESGRKA